MRIVALRAERGDVIRAFDGATHMLGESALRVACAADVLAVFDASTSFANMPSGTAYADRVLDVRALLRLIGHGDTEAGLMRAFASTSTSHARSLLEAIWACASSNTPPDEELMAMRRVARLRASGVALDLTEAKRILRHFEAEQQSALADIHTHWTRFESRLISREAAFQTALHERFGVYVESLALDHTNTTYIGRIVNARQRYIQYSRYADSIRTLLSGDGVLRDPLTYAGTTTGRYTATGAFNLHSLPKHPKPGLESLVQMRRVVVPPPGSWYVARDLVAVEARVLAFLSGEHALTARFRQGEDVYAWFAGQVWPAKNVAKHGANAHLRTIGKVAVLSLGFGLGMDSFRERIHAVDGSVADEDIGRAFELFRGTFRAVMSQHDAAASCLRRAHEGVQDLGVVCGARLELHDDVMVAHLASGRPLYYRGVRRVHAGSATSIWFERSSSTAPAPLLDSLLATRPQGPWFKDGRARDELLPHGLVNNIVQAVARDVCVHLEAELERKGVRVAFSVHDSLVGLCDANDEAWTRAHATMASVMELMPPSLSAIDGIPLASEAEQNVKERFG